MPESDEVTEDEQLRRLFDSQYEDCLDEDVERRVDRLSAFKLLVESDAVDDELDRLKALASDTRYRIVRALVAAEGELCVCELNAMFDVTDSAVSHALSQLVEADLVTRRKEGRWRMYRATNVAVTLVTVLGGDAAGPTVEPPSEAVADGGGSDDGCGC